MSQRDHVAAHEARHGSNHERAERLLPLFLQLRTAQDWLDLTGLVISDLHLCEEASGTLAATLGGVTMGFAGTTPLYQQPSQWSKVGISFTDNTGDRFQAAAGTWNDDGATSWLQIMILKTPTTFTGAHVYGFAGTGGVYSRAQMTGNALPKLALADGTNPAIGLELTGDHRGQTIVLAFGVDRDANRARIVTQLGSLEFDITGYGAFAGGSDVVAIGGFAGLATPNIVYQLVRAEGADAEMTLDELEAIVTTAAQGLGPVLL